jgi:hypothetical protein
MRSGRRLRASLAASCLALVVAVGAHAAPDWGRLDWLVGDWTMEGAGGRQGSGGFTFTPDAGGRVLVRRSHADYPAQDGKPAVRHEDLMVIEPHAAGLRATCWEGDGHVIHYEVRAPEPGLVEFVSTDTAGPGYRLSYRRTPVGLEGGLEIAPSNDRDRFRPYLKWTARRTK